MAMATRASVALLVVLWSLTLAAAGNGSLKVTSFPSGAEVWVDGVNTGKVTPMSVSLTEGDHSITVRLPDSGWNPDTRTVTIVAGNNDLSVTLLPTITAGPPGPAGPAGAEGPQGIQGIQGIQGNQGVQGEPGPAGAPASVRVASSAECPTGGIVVTSGNGDASLPVCNGSQGPQGIQGLQGIQGVQGAQGPTGSPGPPGPPGGAPVVDPATLVGFADNLLVNIGSGLKAFGVSPVYVEVDASMDTSRGSITYTPGKLHVAPFVIAARRVDDVFGEPLPDHGPELAAWFDLARRDDPAGSRTIHITLTDADGEENLTVEFESCVPTTLDTDFAGAVRVLVRCLRANSVAVRGGAADPFSGDDSLHFPDRVFSRQMRLNVDGRTQLVADDVSGGGSRLVSVDFSPRLDISPLRVRAGSVTTFGLDVSSIRGWIAASLARDTNGQFHDVALVGADWTEIAAFSDMFLTYIGLIDPSRTISVDIHGRMNKFIRIGFDLIMRVGHP